MKSKLITTVTIGSILTLFATAGCSDNSATPETQPETANTDTAVIDKPLAEQPKAMVDSAESQINEINQMNEDRLKELDSSQ